MRKEWYVFVSDEREGPYSVEELQLDARITLDTLAWRSGMGTWLPIREIPELKKLFKEPELKLVFTPQEELTLDFEQKPPVRWGLLFFILVLCILIAFIAGLRFSEWMQSYFPNM